MNVNPIVALVGAAANQGLKMFATELLYCDGGNFTTSDIAWHDETLHMLDQVIVAAIIDDRIKYQVGTL